MKKHKPMTQEAVAERHGLTQSAISRRLKKIDAELSADQPLSRQLRLEKLRILKLEVAELEREAAIAKKELVRFDEVEQLIAQTVFAPISQAIIEGKATGRISPEFADEMMRRVRDGIPKPA